MFGAGLPVLAFRFPALPELLTEGRDGLGFGSVDELRGLLWDVLTEPQLLQRLKDGVAVESWGDNWRRNMGPLLLHEGHGLLCKDKRLSPAILLSILLLSLLLFFLHVA